VFAFKANKLYDYHNNYFTIKRFNHLTKFEIIKQKGEFRHTIF